jgi:hypothetical protein
VHLNGRLFTWSNERAHTTLERIDRVFISKQWDTIFPDCELHSLPSLCSDHAPLLLSLDSGHHAKKRFYFRSFWLRLPGFLEVAQQAWHCPLGTVSPFCKLDWLLCNTTWFLKSWSNRFVGSIRVQLKIAKKVIHQLESSCDRRHLLDHEKDIRKHLNLKSLGLASLQCTIVRQESQLLWLKEGDAPMSYPIFTSKPSTHRMCAQDQLFHTYRHKVFTDNQMS